MSKYRYIEQSAPQPPTAIDPRTNTAYVLVRADLYERARPLLEPPAAAPRVRARIAPQMLRSMEAYWRDLPKLLKRKSPKLAAVALANKIARIAWKLMVSGQHYNRAHAVAAGMDKAA